MARREIWWCWTIITNSWTTTTDFSAWAPKLRSKQHCSRIFLNFFLFGLKVFQQLVLIHNIITLCHNYKVLLDVLVADVQVYMYAHYRSIGKHKLAWQQINLTSVQTNSTTLPISSLPMTIVTKKMVMKGLEIRQVNLRRRQRRELSDG